MRSLLICTLLFSLSLTGCAGNALLRGVNRDGQKVYLGPVPVENTEAFQTYLHSERTDVDQQRYLFQRLKDATDLEFLHDGNWYNGLQAYRGGMWLMRNRYEKGQDARQFIRRNVAFSDQGKPHVVKYPDGSLQDGASVLINELDLLEESASKITSMP